MILALTKNQLQTYLAIKSFFPSVHWLPCSDMDLVLDCTTYANENTGER